ncbi:MAG: hypothetical protein KDD64_11050 [Bdellovibrionales bacterium]|nr:hypothetical protein [Bdellovibrionales bacterium]
MSAEISLYFSSQPAIELQRVHFQSRLNDRERVSLRGKSVGGHQGDATFQWTNAVKAVALLFVRAKAHLRENSGAHLGKDFSGCASSLDHALGKPPGWLVDMFGSDSVGRAMVHRFVLRSNPERKRTGEVAISLNESAVEIGKIHLFLDGVPLIEGDVLAAFAELLGEELNPPLPEVSSEGIIEVLLKRRLEREMKLRLATSEGLSHQGVHKTILRLRSGERFQILADGNVLSFLESNLGLSRSEQLGISSLAHDVLREGKAISVALSVSQAGALGIFSHLILKGFPFQLDLEFPSSLGLVDVLQKGTKDDLPGLVSLSLAPAANLLSSKAQNYRPLMLLPRQSYALLHPAQSQALSTLGGTFLINDEEHSNAHFFLDELARKGLLRADELDFEHAEPHEVGSAFREGGSHLRSILGFPYYSILTAFGEVQEFTDLSEEVRTRESILFIRSDLAEEAELLRTLCILIRDSWVTLLEEPGDLKRAVAHLLQATPYRRLVTRFAGNFMAS